jgi:hypothetical protein
MRFTSSRLKIERANKHIADIYAAVRTLPDRYTATVEVNPQTGNEVIKHDLSDGNTITTDLALMIGDAIHNLKCALDYAWIGTIERFVPSALDSSTKFPVRPTKDELESALRGRKIDTAAPTLFELVVSNIKPYQGGDHSIWSVHTLDILDKHRLLIPVLEFAGVDGIELENERGETSNGFTWGTDQKPPYYIPIEVGWRIKNKGHVSVAVLFDERTPAYLMDAPDLLSTFAKVVLNVVELLEGLI